MQKLIQILEQFNIDAVKLIPEPNSVRYCFRIGADEFQMSIGKNVKDELALQMISDVVSNMRARINQQMKDRMPQ